MAKIIIPDDWWTAPATSDDDQTVMVTGRRALQHIIDMGVYNYRVEVTWQYDDQHRGMPDVETSKLMQNVTEALDSEFMRDPVAVLTGIYTGAGERNWVFYTRSLHIFQRKFNEILAPLPAMPLTFRAEEDPQWEEYHEMSQCEVTVIDSN